jgi:hypothetical protein
LEKAKEASNENKLAAQTAAIARDATIVTSKRKKKKSKKKKKRSKKKRKSKKKKSVAKFENTEHFEAEEPNFFNEITNTLFSKITEGFNLLFN